MLVKLDHFPRERGENKKYLSCHHLDNSLSITKCTEAETDWPFNLKYTEPQGLPEKRVQIFLGGVLFIFCVCFFPFSSFPGGGGQSWESSSSGFKCSLGLEPELSTLCDVFLRVWKQPRDGWYGVGVRDAYNLEIWYASYKDLFGRDVSKMGGGVMFHSRSTLVARGVGLTDCFTCG